jgi:hypothetical protein
MGNSLRVDEAVSRISTKVGSDSDGTPSTESHLSQKVAKAAARELEPASQVVAHASLESRSPIALDVLDAMKDDGDLVIAGTCFSPVDGHDGVMQLACGRCPARWP